MDRLYVLKTSGSLIEDEDGIRKDVVAVFLEGVAEPGGEPANLPVVLHIEDAATLTYGLNQLFSELGRGDEFRLMILGTKLLQASASDSAPPDQRSPDESS